jgi:hypothetical protein
MDGRAPGRAPARSCGLADELASEESTPDAGGGDLATDSETMYADNSGTEASETDEEPARRLQEPHAGSATIVCDGAGGYTVDMGSWAGAPCGIAGCVRRHEESHASDWKGRWPDGCKNKKNGDKIPLGGAGYDAFLKASECTAYGVEESCITPLKNAAKTEPCKTTLADHLADTLRQKARFC